MSEQINESYEFGRFSVNPAERLLLRDKELVPLTPKTFDILLILVENGGHLVEKEDLMKRVWPHTFVEEGNLTQNVSLLRKALGERANGPQFIETVPRRGYRFVAPVKKVATNGNGKASASEAEDAPSQVAVSVEDPPSSSIQPQWKLLRNRGVMAGIALVALLVIVGGVSFFSGRSTAGEVAGASAIQSIAVLPFVDEGAGADAEFLDDKIAESLINSLSKLPKLRVVPRSVMLKYKDQDIDPRKIGEELNVRAVVTGRVHRNGDTVSIQADLIDVQNVSQIWGQNYERRLADMLLVQEEISRDIFENLRLRLNVEEQKTLEAYHLYLKGRNSWNKRTRVELQQAIDYFKQAINTDANYAPAYAGLADCYNMQVIYGVRKPREAFPEAKEAATKALELDGTLAEAHTSLAFAKFRWDWDRVGAEREFQAAIRHKPTYAPAHQWYSSYLAAFGRFDEAIASARRAQDLEPLSFIASSHLSWILYLAGHTDQAIAECNKMLQLDPNFFPAHRYLGLAYLQKGMPEKAIASFQRGLQLSGSPLVLAHLGHSYAVAGKDTEARKVLTELSELENQRYVSAYTVAGIHAALGDKEQAFKALEKAYEERDVWFMNVKVDPVFKDLRSDRRFQNLLTRANLHP
jgi:DNA-binding winged helix-turn-helix (wHTH) protein/TolB-like protein/Tfp pilus assembly protein PilF